MLLIRAKIVLLGAVALAGLAWADDRPVPPAAPARPETIEECRAYQRQQNEYSSVVLKRANDCRMRASKSGPIEYINFVLPCAPAAPATTAMKACKEETIDASCAFKGFADKYKDCETRAKAAERKAFDDASALSDKRRSAIERHQLYQTCASSSALPKPDICKSLKGSGSGFEEFQQEKH